MTDTPNPAPRELAPEQARAAFRGGLKAPTSGYSAGWTQANLICLPRAGGVRLPPSRSATPARAPSST